MVSQKFQDFADIFAEEEEARLAEARKVISAEDAAYAALSQEEKDQINKARDAYWEYLDGLTEVDRDEDDDTEEEE
jgi:hypothetical protein